MSTNQEDNFPEVFKGIAGRTKTIVAMIDKSIYGIETEAGIGRGNLGNTARGQTIPTLETVYKLWAYCKRIGKTFEMNWYICGDGHDPTSVAKLKDEVTGLQRQLIDCLMKQSSATNTDTQKLT